MMRVLACVAVLLSAGCAQVAECPGPECACTYGACTCQAGANCDWNTAGPLLACLSDNTCGGTCTNQCHAICRGNSHCSFTMGDSALLTCEGASCNVTVGAHSTASCALGATCHVTCSGSGCAVGCTSSTCTLQCPGDTAAHAIPDGGTC